MSALITNYSKYRHQAQNGFILLEVLVVMSLVLGAWMTLIQSYQVLSLKLAQQQSERAQIRREQDDFEIGLMAMGISHEPSRMSSGAHLMHATSQPAAQVQR